LEIVRKKFGKTSYGVGKLFNAGCYLGAWVFLRYSAGVMS
jgi:hypothetical protein